jgi:AraC-like DNA-binding protein/tetratricopeptide (TPR) repeat protein
LIMNNLYPFCHARPFNCFFDKTLSRLFNRLRCFGTQFPMLVLFVAFCLLPQFGNAQTTASDSLLTVIPTLQGTEKLETLKQLAYSNRNITEGVKYARMLLVEAQKQNRIEYQSLALGKIANHYTGQLDTDSLFITYEPFEKFCHDHKLYKHYFIVTSGIVDRHVQRGNYSQALKKANETYDLSKSTNNDEAMGMSLKNIASVYEVMHQYPEAINYQNKALAVLKQQPRPNFHLTDSYLRLGSIYSCAKQNDQVLVYADSLMAAIDEMHKIDPALNFDQEHFIALVLYASAYSEMNRYDKAFNCLTLAEKKMIDCGLEHNQYMIDQIARTYYKKTGNYTKALEYNKRFLDFLLANNMSSDWGEAMKLQGDIYLKMEKYDDAALFYARSIEVNDSVDKMTYAKQINELRTIYELDKLELEGEKTQLKLKSSRMAAGMLSALALVLVAFVLVVLGNQKKLKAKNRSLYRQITEQQKWADSFGFQPSSRVGEVSSVHTEETSGRASELIERLNALMRKDQLFTQNDLNRKKLADLLATNETYLFEAIKETYNLTFNEYLNVLRLNHARDLLAQPNCEFTIEAVAIDSGFGSRNTFHRLFRERYGLTPVEFRNLACEKVKTNA